MSKHSNLPEEVKTLWMQNFSHTLAFLEAKLGINAQSSKPKDKDLHYLIKGALYEMGRNLTTDLMNHVGQDGQ